MNMIQDFNILSDSTLKFCSTMNMIQDFNILSDSTLKFCSTMNMIQDFNILSDSTLKFCSTMSMIQDFNILSDYTSTEFSVSKFKFTITRKKVDILISKNRRCKYYTLTIVIMCIKLHIL